MGLKLKKGKYSNARESDAKSGEENVVKTFPGVSCKI